MGYSIPGLCMCIKDGELVGSKGHLFLNIFNDLMRRK